MEEVEFYKMLLKGMADTLKNAHKIKNCRDCGNLLNKNNNEVLFCNDCFIKSFKRLKFKS